jgi:Subtilase family
MPKLSMSSSPDELNAAARISAAPGHQIALTGRTLVLFREGVGAQSVASLQNVAGLRVANAADYVATPLQLENLDADALVLPELGVAVVAGDPGQIQSLSAASDEQSPILYIEPEQILYALQDPKMLSKDYLQGYKDAVDHLHAKLTGGAAETIVPEAAVPAAVGLTWGLQATRVGVSRFSGKGIKVAVLDTGFELQHPDFAGRPIVSQSFVAAQPAQDGHGHGTHCIGSSCGPQTPPVAPRYGIGHQALIHVGKVLSNQGSGGDGGILAGIDWAIRNKCVVVSMSLGARVAPGTPPSPIYEAAGTRALAAGTLIVAAAGNDSDRATGSFWPVSRPANSKTILAVGAVTSALQIANFSNRGLNPNGGEVNLVGPGVGVYSSWILPQRYNTISGTSMATPHVAGIAALYAEAFPNDRGTALWNRLQATARVLPAIAVADRGAGLVQAP